MSCLMNKEIVEYGSLLDDREMSQNEEFRVKVKTDKA